MANIFTKHPHSINETYFQHLRFAFRFGGTMVLGGLACIIHSIFPFVFQKTGSNILIKMTHDFVERMPHCDEKAIALSDTIQKKKR